MIEDKNIALTPISDLGEFGLIEKITAPFSFAQDFVMKGPGDDCAVWEKDAHTWNLISTDILAEGVHFDLAYVPLKHLGYKSVAVNVSDICAMRGSAWGITVSIAVSNRFPLEAVEELYAGIKLACDHYQITLLGGDTTSSKQGLMISVSVLGTVSKENITLRSGAKKTDLICVSGDLGAAYAGLMILQREKEVFKQNPEIQPDLSGFEYVVERQLKSEARVDIIDLLNQNDIQVTAMIDLSDGLSSDLNHLCKNSQVGALLYQDKIPVDLETGKAAEQFSQTAYTYALNGGEDYELLFTVPVTEFEKVNNLKGISIIGYCTDAAEGVHLQTSSGQWVEIKNSGWNHF